MKSFVLTAVLVAAMLAHGPAVRADTPATLPPALTPTAIAGSGINVVDLEAQKAWYMSRLGMKLVATYSRNGAPFEYIMAMTTDGKSGAILALLKTQRPAGPNGFSRVILNAPDPKALAQRLAAQGVTVREIIPDSAYFITDPEGNIIELYRPAPAKP